MFSWFIILCEFYGTDAISWNEIKWNNKNSWKDKVKLQVLLSLNNEWLHDDDDENLKITSYNEHFIVY